MPRGQKDIASKDRSPAPKTNLQRTVKAGAENCIMVDTADG